MMGLFWLLTILFAHHSWFLLPFVQPFAAASSGLSQPHHQHADQFQSVSQNKRQRILQGIAPTSLLLHAAVDVLNQPSSTKTKLNWFHRQSSPTTASSSDHFKPSSLSWFERLMFTYVKPLLTKASRQQLEVEDVPPLSKDETMDVSVGKLSEHYQLVRSNSQKKIEQAKAAVALEKNRQQQGVAVDTAGIRTSRSASEKLVNLEAAILTKALLLHQRPVLVRTAVMRVLNTAIQAFPAILVARLLRAVEAGTTQPAKQAIVSALLLLTVLMIKMIAENQYFHHVVHTSGEVRGSLAGLIFDKCLRLPGGGSGVAHQHDDGGRQSQRLQHQQHSNSDAEKGGNTNSQQPPKTLGVGGVLNLMQSDAGILESAALQFHTLWDGPLQIFIYTTLLFRYLGSSVLWGIGVLLLTIPINSATLRILNQMSRYENEAKDARTKRTAESIAHMKLLKLQGWTRQFASDIQHDREQELSRHVRRGAVRALNSAISNAVPSLVLVATLGAYVRSGRPLVASTIFTAISLFNQLRFPLFFYPMLIDALANGRNAMRRIATYLSSEELIPYVSRVPLDPPKYGELDEMGYGGSIHITCGNFFWPATGSSSQTTQQQGAHGIPSLSNAELLVKPGEIVAVVGSVGSGKTALIKALLGELFPVPRIVLQQAISNTSMTHSVGGDYQAPFYDLNTALEKPCVVARGKVAYCAQEAWLSKGTIREAIVFGREYDEVRYREAIYDAGLDNDIMSGILADETDVGEGGSALSGGQRARVALARALYSTETGVYLLDDCLAALDASVGATVFERLTRRLRHSRAATIIVTNDPSLPRRCDRVVLMSNVPSSSSCSAIIDQGTYDELIARGHNLRRISAALNETDSHGRTTESDFLPIESNVGANHTITTLPKRSTTAKNIIRVVGGYKRSTNATDCFFPADPECEVAMSNCPEYTQGILAELAGSSIPQLSDETDMIMIETYASNSSVVSLSVALSPSSESEQSISKTSTATVVTSAVLSKKTFSADDTMSVAAVPWSTYVSYIKSVRGNFLVLAMIGSFLMANGAQFFQQYTVAKWTEASSAGIAAALNMNYMRSLVNAAAVVSVFLWLRSFLLMQVGVRASKFLHSRMLASVFSAPMSFFDSTPSGQLLSRFGKETETVDHGVPDSMGQVSFCFLQIFMSMGSLMGVITPGMMVPLGIVSVMYLDVMSQFRRAARDLKRIETKTRSPIYTQFGEALRGTETIRSIPHAPERWAAKHRALYDSNIAVFLTTKVLDRWLSIRLETLGNSVVFTAAVASVFLTRIGRLQAGSAGWGLTQSLAITGLLTWAVRCLADLETNMMSVTRVMELTDIDHEDDAGKGSSNEIGIRRRPMPVEPNLHGDALRPLFSDALPNASLAPLDSSALIKSGWPWRGNVCFSNVSMRYNPSSPLILRGITVTVPAGTTLGVVGRTGSGKSSLLLTLFRIVEIENGGSIEIDGVDIRSVGLDWLRQSLAIIPQDPVLFAGTLAYNLDATGHASIDDMWKAMQAASPELTQQFRRSNGMNTYVTEGGKNLSVGQRQLICLARALLRKSKILVLDEATSSVDAKTDHDVQETIRREFVGKGVTVITVAHRLETVLTYDRIAVLGNGQILEYGSPAELLRDPNGELKRLVDADRRNKQKGIQTTMKKQLETISTS